VDGKIAGLTWPQTCVLVAACKTAFDLSDRRITVRRLAEQIESFVPDRATINECLDGNYSPTRVGVNARLGGAARGPYRLGE